LEIFNVEQKKYFVNRFEILDIFWDTLFLYFLTKKGGGGVRIAVVIDLLKSHNGLNKFSSKIVAAILFSVGAVVLGVVENDGGRTAAVIKQQTK
jgi:hypothetical protein